jgi:uncharacterized protein (TIGR03435 family)
LSTKTLLSSLCLAAWCLTGGSQTGFPQSSLPAFEVASAKSVPAYSGFRPPVVRKYENGRLTMHNVSFMDIVTWAFDKQLWDIVVPGWAEPRPGQPLYVIDAEADGPVPEQQVKLMLQRLLAERFQLTAHHEMREGVHRVLRVAKGGPKLKEVAAAEPDIPPVRNDQANSRMTFRGVTIAGFLARLNLTGSGAPIYDRTGLSGRYDFTLDYGKYLDDSDPEYRLDALTQARIGALRDLGLEVVELKIPVDTLVVDYADKVPAAN